MERRNWNRWPLLLMGAALLVSTTSCCWLENRPTAVLEGTWKLTGDLVSADVTDFLITFNDRGEITALSYKYKNATIEISAHLINSASTVDGSDVTITATWYLVGLNALSFVGQIDSTETVINGTTEFELWVSPGIDVTVPPGAGTLTKQP